MTKSNSIDHERIIEILDQVHQVKLIGVLAQNVFDILYSNS